MSPLDASFGDSRVGAADVRYTAIDLFAGAGGATQGLIDAGVTVLGAVEYDSAAAQTYRLNHPQVVLWERDIRKVPATEIKRALGLQTGELTLLKSCPPCQGFSSLAEGRISADDPRNDLVGHTLRFVRALRPHAVLVENVPGLGRDPRSITLQETLQRVGYSVRTYMVNAADFGVPQKRKRLIILALRGRRAPLPDRLPPEFEREPATIRAAFGRLSTEVAVDDPLSVRRVLPERVLRRVSAIPVGGNRFDLPDELQLQCHKKLTREGKNGAHGPYGRLRWDEPAPTLTTRCTTPSCGPYIHPIENRPITLREAAAIQTFPPGYKFAGTRGEIERQIGNAVPVRMASSIATTALSAIR